jgi:multisubunit Na+/H+ antiporter MnhG subunit
LLWTPVALALAVGWPALLLSSDATMARGIGVAGVLTFILGLSTLGLAWARGKPPRSHRDVLLHLVIAGALVSLTAPFAMVWLIEAAAAQRNPGAEDVRLPLSASLSMIPLTVLVGLPTAFISALIFAVVALVKPPRNRPAQANERELFP